MARSTCTFEFLIEVIIVQAKHFHFELFKKIGNFLLAKANCKGLAKTIIYMAKTVVEARYSECFSTAIAKYPPVHHPVMTNVGWFLSFMMNLGFWLLKKKLE
jgi:hypothetical protein